MVQRQGGGQQGLQTHGARLGLGEGAALVFGRFGAMGRGDDVDQAVAHGLNQSLPVALGAQGRVQPVEGAIVADVDLVEAQVVDRGRGRDLKAPGTGARQRLQRALSRNLVDQEARAGLLDQGQIAL